MAWSMFKHALFLVFNNLGSAFKASFVPMVIIGATWFLWASFLWASTIGIENFMSQNPNAEASSAFLMNMILFIIIALMSMILFIIIAFFCSAWVAVTWHRFILLGEDVNIIPSIKVKHILSYIGKSILIILIMIFIMLVPAMLLGVISAEIMEDIFPNVETRVVFLIINTFVVSLLGLWLWFRFAMALPAAAIGNVYGIQKSWSASKEYSGTIFKLGLIIALISALIQAVTFLFSDTLPLLGFALSLFISWINMLVGITLLTTLYGHIVEGRELMVKS